MITPAPPPGYMPLAWGLLLPLIAFAESMIVMGWTSKRAYLVALEKTDEDRTNGQPGSTLVGRNKNLGDVDRINMGHVGHGLGGERQRGGQDLGEGWATCFAIVPLPNIFRTGAIKNYQGH